MSFIDIRLPTDISADAEGGPEFLTTINSTKGRTEFRNINHQYPRYRYLINYGLKSTQQIIRIISIFNICKGRAFSFRYKDWADFNATDQILGTGDGKREVFQLQKSYIIDKYSATRIVTKPVENTVSVYIDKQAVETSDVSVNYVTGAITFISPPKLNQIVTATFEFDVEVRFDNDFLPIKMRDRNHYIVDKITLIEV